MSAQEFLWSIPNAIGPSWAWFVGVPALVASLVTFAKLIMNHDFSALVLARSMLALGQLLLFMSILNSGWMPYAAALFAWGSLLASLLLITGWCERADKTLTMPVAILRWIGQRWFGVVDWIAGRRQHWVGPDDPRRPLL